MAELETKRLVKVLWVDEKMKTDEIRVYPDKAGTVKTILDEVKKQVQLSPEGSGRLR